MTPKQAIEVLCNYADTAANDHCTPCDGITECGECFICSEFQPLAETFKVLGHLNLAKKWVWPCATIKKRTKI